MTNSNDKPPIASASGQVEKPKRPPVLVVRRIESAPALCFEMNMDMPRPAKKLAKSKKKTPDKSAKKMPATSKPKKLASGSGRKKPASNRTKS